MRRFLFEYGKDFTYILIAIAALSIILYMRRKSRNKDRVAPYREPLVAEDFYKTCRPLVAGQRPTIVWIVRHYLPDFQTGAVCMTRDINRYFTKTLGWEVAVIVPHSSATAYEDIPIYQFGQQTAIENVLRRAHCIMTQYQVIETAAITATRAKKPLVLLSHDDSLGPWITKAKDIHDKVYLINNSEWLDTLYRGNNIPSMILYPPVFVKDYVTHTSRTYVTIVNMNENKGIKTFYRVAALLPDVPFLAIKGSYGDQIMPPADLKNGTVWSSKLDMRHVYAVTGILCMPSKAESWGRVAIEAACSGIPVIAHPATGLKEALGPAGIFADREDPAAWATEIRRLQESALEYETRSRAVSRRAHELNPTKQLEELRGFLLAIPGPDPE